MATGVCRVQWAPTFARPKCSPVGQMSWSVQKVMWSVVQRKPGSVTCGERMRLSGGARLGHYEILAPLGRGGMGEVYRARDSRLGREVAVKVLPEQLADDSVALARLEREARAIAELSHPNIVVIFDLGA